MKYRSRTEIVAMILEASRSGVTKTKIMYKAYLSYTQVKEYISFLRDNELLDYEEGTQLYKITAKGLKFLHSYGEITELVTPITNGKQLNF
ncbi:MAG TPA: winged helix-turn-helix domain-containing protein [Nitrosopumilaceae archaeon]|nr:winged helix-turn-helix domain-containing protein [Nitrosopumilaceae archaeon]